MGFLDKLQKKCTKCKTIKGIDKFYADKTRKDHLACWCKSCSLNKSRDWCKKNPERLRENTNRWKKANPEKFIESIRKWQKANPECGRKSNKRWTKANYEKKRGINIRYIKNNSERIRERNRKRHAKNRATPRGQLNHNVSSAIRISLCGNKQGRQWEPLVGYTLEQLKKHLEKKFKPGMSWENYGRNGWHIDHKTPVSVFNFEKPEDEDFKRCWALKNLQPLWAADNFKKNNKIDKQFQPQLIF